ncbi:multidrug resistance-associated ABC transporter [Gloeophyllum trabeum ATCC 11539]|uniref:Multidrug resistance-associated ABC transporter n=1 Tax=Gloeophyllum trabeum (strain ATCC 11539 / FP-39264 / Madison 617) TaxID=670483 RepID=S7RJJ1_GLOTA|nr:multidrug resistance-associated ABC transporter [Gloeophyllum trabeum ATCC 11539]EPQ52804.1 multidrug resistance-associated ABC transporter [Gloeophyllum trabeum ATCC 11539]
MYNPLHPPPAPPAFGGGTVLPEARASILSRLIFSWVSPLLKVGFSRPLEKEDLWQLPDSRLTAHLSHEVERNFYERCSPEKRPPSLRGSSVNDAPPSDGVQTLESEKRDSKATVDAVKVEGGNHEASDDKSPRKETYDESLLKALNNSFFYRWWSAGILKLCAETLNITTPLVTKLLLTYLTNSYYAFRLTPEEREAAGLGQVRGIGYGIGLAFAIFAMQEASSLMTTHYMLRGMTTGQMVRTAVIGMLFRKSLRLSGRGRAEHSVGQITTMISSDAGSLDNVGLYAHELWIAPIQIIVGLALLIYNLGYSALVGLGVFIFGAPVQGILVAILMIARRKGLAITDQRIRLTSEVLQGIRLVKLYAWETFYGHKIAKLRAGEISRLRMGAWALSVMIALSSFVPLLAVILSFITYALTSHSLNVAIIFSSLQWFNMIRAPLTVLPIVVSQATQAIVALERISKFLLAEELQDPYEVDLDRKEAISIEGDFTWERAAKLNPDNVKADATKQGGKKKNKKREGAVLPTSAPAASEADAEDTETPFELKDLKVKIPRGQFVAVVGQIGSGKTSLLQAMLGEMRRTKGNVIFGGSVAYAPQAPWIMNATLKENIVFGQPEDDVWFQEVIRACCLEPDLKLLPHGQYTEIGEKGINLSGGQKARISLARAAYARPDIVLLDDVLSAVDAWVGKSILDNCLIKGPLANSTRVLVTHALHVLDKADYIYVLDHGVIREQGRFEDLSSNSVLFSHIMEEFGNTDDLGIQTTVKKKRMEKPQEGALPKVDEARDILMQEEERVTGAVGLETYKKYFHYVGGLLWAFAIVVLLVLEQGATVSNNLFLGFWTAGSIKGFHQGQYIGVYAGLGVAQAVFALVSNLTFTLAGLSASLAMFQAALMHVLRSPVSFFDTTPMGRIISRLAKDQDTVDFEVSMVSYSFLTSAMNVLGTVGLVFYTFPYLGIIFVPLGFLYYVVSIYYRRSSVETKRLDSLMRSQLYASYTECLTGLSSLRAYRRQEHFVVKAYEGLDLENRALYMTIVIQLWLATRLDFFGNLLILGIGLFAAGFRHSVNPSRVGVVLSYSLTTTIVSSYAQMEQAMNAVERLLFYTELPLEGYATTSSDPPPAWPEAGRVKFSQVALAYRPGLPVILHDVSFEVQPGEKIGIVGRTGAGKSSLLQALFRTVELQKGSIEIDGYDIRNIGLGTLRSRLALVPQANTLFLGTLRENLDPENTRTDAEIISALRRAWLLPQEGPADPATEAKFSLDARVSDEGGNFSAGEKQLLALCRALVKNSRIIVLDEATSSVDVETDAKVQKTIQTQFSNSTLLCIAHRLNTIAYYDRILVMDSGRVAEYDTPLNLYDKSDSIFRSLCDEAHLSRKDIERIRASALLPSETQVATED